MTAAAIVTSPGVVAIVTNPVAAVIATSPGVGTNVVAVIVTSPGAVMIAAVAIVTSPGAAMIAAVAIVMSHVAVAAAVEEEAGALDGDPGGAHFSAFLTAVVELKCYRKLPTAIPPLLH
jgi:hypothetical protein